MKTLAILALGAGCSFQSGSTPGNTPPIDARPIDAVAAVDAKVVEIDARLCYGGGLVKNVCLTAPTSTAVTLTAAMSPIDTSVDANCTLRMPQTGGPELCVIAGLTVTVASDVVVIGARPLVLLGTDRVTINAALDASSKANPQRIGAGGNAADCTATGAGKPGTDDSGGAGGGGGGGGSIAGGDGGLGDNNNNGQPNGKAPGGKGGGSRGTPTFLRGGCAGGKGGDGDTNATRPGGAGGPGGGAIYVIAGSTITLGAGGGVFASGAGGSGGDQDSDGIETGGGGGGAGGMIGFDAPTIELTGRVAANGGGGGGGGGIAIGGARGGDGTTTGWNQRANGGAGAQVDTGNGAQGTCFNGTNNLDGETDDGGGGGGGGALGLVWTYGTVTGGTQVSPTAVPRT